ncbi:CBS domain-containing protein [Actinoallomurus sp. NPDC050550]|uniref:CBS domain-containing protein n=1 Tax=Actinoallomurus sp. NPDC050550 TaxID=3154937 RepID=UPI0033D36FE8
MPGPGKLARRQSEALDAQSTAAAWEDFGPRRARPHGPIDVFADRDIVKQGVKMNHATVQDYMTTDIVCLRPDDGFKVIVRALAARGVSGAPVVDEGRRVIGVHRR